MQARSEPPCTANRLLNLGRVLPFLQLASLDSRRCARGQINPESLGEDRALLFTALRRALSKWGRLRSFAR